MSVVSHHPDSGTEGRGRVGMWGAIAIGIGGMVGGGIFAVLGLVAEEAKGGAPLGFLIAGGIAILTASSYASLSKRYPSRGGSVVFVDQAFGVGLVTGSLNSLLWFGYLITLSLYAVAFANYAGSFLASGPTPLIHHILISAAIVLPTGLNLMSAALVAETETAIVVLKLVMLSIVVGAGATTVDTTSLSVSAWPSIPAIAAAGMLVFVAYEGFELIANAGDDIRQPRRNIPRALYASVGVVIVVYVAVAVVTVGSLTADQITGAADFALAEAARPSLGGFGFGLVGVSAVLATLSAINATLYGTARLSYSIALEGELPPAFERKVWTEPVGLLVTAGVSLLLANTLNVGEISSIASSVFLIVFGAVNLAALRTAASPARRVTAAGGAIGCLAALVLLVIDTTARQPLALGVLVAMLAVSVAGESAWLHHRRELKLSSDP